jgi:hypothetical protein
MRAIPYGAFLLGSAVLAACTGGSERIDVPQPPAPPDGSGIVRIAMEGHWRVTSVERRDNPPPWSAPPLYHWKEGQVLRLDATGFAALDAFPLRFESLDPHRILDVAAHANFHDGRIAFWHLWATPKPYIADAPGYQLEFMIGAVDERKMLGVVHWLVRPVGGSVQRVIHQMVVLERI